MPNQEQYTFTNLQVLESESIHIIREVTAEFEKPVLLYSVGKDSSVLAHLAMKAFFPEKVPFPFLHVDTGYKFPEMYSFRDKFVKRNRLQLEVFRNEHAIRENLNPVTAGTIKCCTELKTKALLEALTNGEYDAAFGGARRDEEKSRAKERIYSFRDCEGQWDPKNQRPELWNIFNGKINRGESIRVFPLSNWTELDIWMYIFQEKIDVVPLYFAKKRDIIVRNGQLIPVFPGMHPPKGDRVTQEMCRFRTLGCHYCSGAIRSDATTVLQIIREMLIARNSERITRIIDYDQECSMEQKKREGYF